MAVEDSVDDDDTLLSGEIGDTADLAGEVEDDGLDIEIVDEFNEDDFDEDFDDDFEEEVVGEYELTDDMYGKEFDTTFGHLTDPTREKPAPLSKEAQEKELAAKKEAAAKKAEAAKKAAAAKKNAAAAKPVKKPARKK